VRQAVAREVGWITRANALTLLRLLAAPALAAAILGGAYGIASALFAGAVVSDLADGWVARKFGETSPRGALFDHAVDATFVAAGSAALAWLGALPAPLPPLIAIAFVQYALDSGAGMRGSLKASALGRCNGIAYYAIVALSIGRALLDLGESSRGVVMGLGWMLVISSIASIIDRLHTARSERRIQA